MGVVQLPADLARSIRGLGSRIAALERRVSKIARGGEDWIPLALTNGWANYGGGFAPAAYYKDGGGRVHLRGLITGGAAGTACGFVPAGYQPEFQELFTVHVTGSTGRLDVQPSNGALVVGQTGVGGYVQLSGISFRADH